MKVQLSEEQVSLIVEHISYALENTRNYPDHPHEHIEAMRSLLIALGESQKVVDELTAEY